MREKVSDAVQNARPYVERVKNDQEFREHVKNAYDSARSVYDELFGTRGATGVAMRVARDKEIQDDLRKAIEELRAAGTRVQGKESHTGRNVMILLVGIALGALFNPWTGSDTRRWLKDKALGPEQPFEYQSNQP